MRTAAIILIAVVVVTIVVATPLRLGRSGIAAHGKDGDGQRNAGQQLHWQTAW